MTTDTERAAVVAEGLTEAINNPDDELMFILGRPGFMFIEEAQLFRLCGHEIPTKAEDEQAFFIHRMLGHYIKHGAGWREAFSADIRAHIEQVRDHLRSKADG